MTMTKEQLREYRSSRDELAELRAMLRNDTSEEVVALYRAKIEALEQNLRLIENALETLGPTERRLMRLRYIEGLSWQSVSQRIHYSWQQTHRIHKNALAKLRKGEK